MLSLIEGADEVTLLTVGELRQSLLLSSGDPTIFFTSQIAGTITIIAMLLILVQLLKMVWNRSRVTG